MIIINQSSFLIRAILFFLISTNSVFSKVWINPDQKFIPVNGGNTIQPDIERRCAEDYLEPHEAVERLHWALKCGLISQKVLNENVGKERPIYPVFHYPGQNPIIIRTPKSRGMPCLAELNGNRVFDGEISRAFCTASCYTPDQRILFENAEFEIIDAFLNMETSIVTVSRNSTLEKINFTTSPVRSFTEELTETNHKILHIQTSSGANLKVTLNHPLVTSTGHMKEARALRVGDSLLLHTGIPDLIIDIDEIDYFGKVYNVDPKTDHFLEKIVVAEGLLNGSSWYQNDGVMHLNRVVFRESILAEKI